MQISIAFWVLTVALLALSALQIMGQNLLMYIIPLLIIDVAVLEFNRSREHMKIANDFKHEILEKIETLTKAAYNFETNLDLKINSAVENYTQKYKGEVKEGLDRIAEKAIEIENRANEIKNNLISIASGFDERLRNLEGPKEEI
jgi:uncharacterized phage infection (PIP) family protein YhgE